MTDDTTFSERFETISNADADGEQLVSVSVPPTESVDEMRQRVEEDHAEAEYLNDREEVRKPLKQALEETRRILHEYDETPENGLAVYVGTVGDDLVEVVFDDPPAPIGDRTYGYANEFDTTPLEPSASGTATHGLLIVARESATLGRYDGETIEQVESIESDVPSKQDATGRDEDRFQGRSEERRTEFFDSVGDAVERVFLDSPPEGEEPASHDLEGLLLGGSEVTAERFHDGDHLPEALTDEVLGPFNVEYAAETGLRQLVDAAEAAGALEATDAREALDRFFDALDEEDEHAAGGVEDVEEALEYGAVETLLLAESLSAEEAQTLEARAEEEGASTIIVPTGLDRAEQLQEAFDGVGALLRFPVE
ncbi:baeRF10 domain-containing protein [Natronococcus roseus]|uniref:baeRF10 domain-containing protein n=1 Tax=Natronococcus roseus TaxID=1052014 RepID=UPI00374CD503